MSTFTSSYQLLGSSSSSPHDLPSDKGSKNHELHPQNATESVTFGATWEAPLLGAAATPGKYGISEFNPASRSDIKSFECQTKESGKKKLESSNLN